jgi:hypothetical protein
VGFEMKDRVLTSSKNVAYIFGRHLSSDHRMSNRKRATPAKTGNVVFLKTLPAAMQSVDHSPLDRASRERLNLELNCFCVSLLFNGRPGKDRQVILVRGHTMEELIGTGAVMKLSPWHNTKDNPFPKLKIFEVHGSGVSGWWAEISPSVLAYLSFSGMFGLEAHDIACLLAESQFPDPDLTDWAAAAISDNSLNIDNAAEAVPESSRQYLGVNFRTGLRTLRLATDRGTDDKILFSVYEHDNSIEPSLL